MYTTDDNKRNLEETKANYTFEGTAAEAYVSTLVNIATIHIDEGCPYRSILMCQTSHCPLPVDFYNYFVRKYPQHNELELRDLAKSIVKAYDVNSDKYMNMKFLTIFGKK